MRRILIVDDETEFAEMIKMRLEANGFQVSAAQDGQEGLRMAEEERPHLILLDVMMPGMDGFEVLRKLRRSSATSKIPVVMLTAKGESKAIFRAQEQGADDYLIKPCKSEELVETCHRYS